MMAIIATIECRLMVMVKEAPEVVLADQNLIVTCRWAIMLTNPAFRR